MRTLVPVVVSAEQNGGLGTSTEDAHVLSLVVCACQSYKCNLKRKSSNFGGGEGRVRSPGKRSFGFDEQSEKSRPSIFLPE